MYNTFYITEPSEGLYNLRLVRNHECIHVGRDLDKVKEIIRKYVIKFKGDPERILKRIKRTNYGHGTMISREGRMHLEEKYAEGKDNYRELIDQTITESLAELNLPKKPTSPKKNNPFKHTYNAVKKEAGNPIPKEKKVPEITNMKPKKASKIKHKVSVTML